jgi:hypothetical protein
LISAVQVIFSAAKYSSNWLDIVECEAE